MKPKLDTFLSQKMGIKNGNDKKSLDYKVQITCEQPPKTVKVGILASKKNGTEDSYSIFYGNTGRDKKLEAVWSDPTLTVICFDNKIKEAIENHITEFFFVTNFGMMQDKGFGSYIPKGTESTDKSIVMKWMAENQKTTSCWTMSLKRKTPDKNANVNKQELMIKTFYVILKSGKSFGKYERSFLYEYMHKNKFKIREEQTVNVKSNIDNEKAWMKQTKIAPAYSRDGKNDEKHDRKDKNARYVRAFLGLSGTQTWQSEHGKVNILISDPKEKINCISSPVFFKIIGFDIYFTIGKVPEEIYDYEFEFSGMNKKKDRLKTPSKDMFTNDAFDTEALMKAYVSYFNEKVVDNIKNEFSKVTGGAILE